LKAKQRFPETTVVIFGRTALKQPYSAATNTSNYVLHTTNNINK